MPEANRPEPRVTATRRLPAGLLKRTSRRTMEGTASPLSERALRAAFDAVPHGVLVVDAELRIVEMGAGAERMTGVARATAIGRPLSEWTLLAEGGDGALLPLSIERALRAGATAYVPYVRFERPDGRLIWIELRAAPLGDGLPAWAVITFDDVTDRHGAKSLRCAIEEIDRQIMGRLDLGSILEAICRGVVGLGFRLAWIGLAREDGSIEISSRGRAGDAVDCLSGRELRWDDRALPPSPPAIAIRTGEVVAVEDVATDERLGPWRERAMAAGLGSCVHLPLRSDGSTIAVLSACRERAGAFEPSQVEMLSRLARQAAHAILAADAYARLARTADRERRILETMLEGVWAIDRDARTTYANLRMAEILGYAVDEMLGRSVYEFMDESVRPLAERSLAARWRGISEELEFRLRRKDGTEVWTKIKASPLHGDDGCVVGALALVSDVTEEKRTQLGMRRIMLAVEQASEAIIVTDAEGVVQYVNPAFCARSGYSPDEAVGRRPNLVRSGVHDGVFYASLWATLKAGRTWSGILTNRRKDGSLYHESTVIAPVREDGAIVNFVAVKRDVTHELELEAQLHQAQKLEAIGQLAGGIAHDFNNALTGVIGYVEVALLDLAEGSLVRENILEARRCAERAAAIARQLLIFSRRAPAELHPLNLNATVEGLAKMLMRLIGDGVTLALTLAPDLWLARADEVQVEQVLTNLAVNARDAMSGAGRIEITTANVEKAAPPGGSREGGPAVLLSVADTGSGMSEEVRGHLFEPFFTTKPKGKGTGLGLAVVHGIVALHGGWIEVETAPLRGTTMKVFLPRAEGAAASARPAPASERLPRGSETVLVADDDEAVRALVARVLERLGYRVIVASSGYEAIGIADCLAEEIDLLVADVVMPGASGPSVAAKLEARRPGLKTLFMTGYHEDKVEEQRLPLGAALLQKPFTMAAIATRVRELLDAPRGSGSE